MIWPVAHFLLDDQHAFVNVFSNADFLPLAALLIFGCWRELESAIFLGEVTVSSAAELKLTLQSSPLVILAIYGFVKYKVLDFSLDGNATLPDATMSGIAVFSIIIMIFSASACYYTKWYLLGISLASLKTGQTNDGDS